MNINGPRVPRRPRAGNGTWPKNNLGLHFLQSYPALIISPSHCLSPSCPRCPHCIAHLPFTQESPPPRSPPHTPPRGRTLPEIHLLLNCPPLPARLCSLPLPSARTISAPLRDSRCQTAPKRLCLNCPAHPQTLRPSNIGLRAIIGLRGLPTLM